VPIDLAGLEQTGPAVPSGSNLTAFKQTHYFSDLLAPSGMR